MFNKVLVANRGEIALRIIRACHELGIKTVAIYSQADEDSLHVQLANEAYCVGPAQSAKSYLNVANIMSVALMSGADAIHPGYGFMAENATFAEICADHQIKFIGPSANMIRIMGDKATAKKTMADVGVPVVPGLDGTIADAELVKGWAKHAGYPIIIKATAGGGGKGMIESDLALEIGAVKQYNDAVALATKEGDNGSRDLLVQLLKDEEEHVDFLEAQMHLIKELGYERYLTMQMGEDDE